MKALALLVAALLAAAAVFAADPESRPPGAAQARSLFESLVLMRWGQGAALMPSDSHAGDPDVRRTASR